MTYREANAGGPSEGPAVYAGGRSGDRLDTTCDCAFHPVTVRVAPHGRLSAWARIAIKGLQCDACAARVEHALADLPGVAAARLRCILAVAIVRYDPARVTPDDLLRAVQRARGHTPPEPRCGPVLRETGRYATHEPVPFPLLSPR